MHRHGRRRQVQDEYGELIGYLEIFEGTSTVAVLDVDGYELCTARSADAGRRHLLNADYNAKTYRPPARR